jgi:uncharacterized protein with HEPN domain
MLKKSTKRDKVYLGHIEQSIGKIEEYLKGIGFEELQNDDKSIDALARQLGIIGEAANNLSDDFKEKFPQLPYRGMISMRNFLIHEYPKTDCKSVWDTSKNDIPVLKKMVKHILKTL